MSEEHIILSIIRQTLAEAEMMTADDRCLRGLLRTCVFQEVITCLNNLCTQYTRTVNRRIVVGVLLYDAFYAIIKPCHYLFVLCW